MLFLDLHAAASLARERVTFVLFSAKPSLVAVGVEGLAAVPAEDLEERGPRAEHDDRPVEQNSRVKSPSGIDGEVGGALELALREEVAGSGLSGRHGCARSSPGLGA